MRKYTCSPSSVMMSAAYAEVVYIEMMYSVSMGPDFIPAGSGC